MRSVAVLLLFTAAAAGQSVGEPPAPLVWDKLKGNCPASLDWLSLRGTKVLVTFGQGDVATHEPLGWKASAHGELLFRVQGGSEFLLDQAIKQSGYDGCVLYDPKKRNAANVSLVDEFGMMVPSHRFVCGETVSYSIEPHDEPYGIRLTESTDDGRPSTGESSAQRYALYNHPLRMMVAEVWDTPTTRVQSPPDLDEHSYDITAYRPSDDRDLLLSLVRHQIESTLHVVVEKEASLRRVYVLTATKLSSQTQPSKDGTPKVSRADSGSAIGTAQT